MIRALPYIIVGLIIAALSGAALWYRGEAAQAETERVRVEAQNTGLLKIVSEQGAAIANLTNQRAIDERLTSELSTALAAIQSQQTDLGQALADLKDTDADARTFLDTPLPDSLKRVLGNRAGTAPGAGSSQAKPAR